MKWLILGALLFLQGCSSNYFLYSPNDKIVFSKDDFSHPVKDSFIRSRSGNTLHLQHHLSDNPQGLVIHFHGNRGNLSQTVEKVVWLVDEGYDVMLVDYSGYGLSNGKPTRENLALDAQTVFEISHGLAHQHKVIVATSMGGAIALDGLAKSKLERYFDLLVIDSSFDSYQNLARDVVANVPIAKWFSSRIPALVSDERSPASNIKQIVNIDTIIAHCNDDRLIPITRGKALYQVAGENSQFWQFSGCRHARTFTDEFPNNQQRLLAHIRKNRGASLVASNTLTSP